MKKLQMNMLMIVMLIVSSFTYAQTTKTSDEFSYALGLFKNGDFERAGIAFAEIYQTASDIEILADSCFMAALSYFQATDFPTSYIFCDKFMQSFPSHPNMPDIQFLQGRILFKIGLYEDAILVFDTFMNKYPDSPFSSSVLFWKGESYYQIGDFAQALSIFNKVKETWPNTEATSLTAWRITVMALESREAKYARLAEFESRRNMYRDIQQMQENVYGEQRLLRDYLWSKAISRYSATPNVEIQKAIIDNISRNDRLNRLLDAKERALKLVILKIENYLKDIAP